MVWKIPIQWSERCYIISIKPGGDIFIKWELSSLASLNKSFSMMNKIKKEKEKNPSWHLMLEEFISISKSWWQKGGGDEGGGGPLKATAKNRRKSLPVPK